ncbi:class C beta-lactamase-related serine hydrolase [Seongchinamella unica]|uniref:Class C beta-lactamase-related serine hydrolase n=1 Tax=Seongchinamella unica TaxID=2547392 RepID=A0A4R5LSD6_9GAMM|nr:serine hydrolase [Seongchinamella unica]TDG13819.1 class C beta-lactamase-related serine hydrolase [Seongchinamella unica]
MKKILLLVLIALLAVPLLFLHLAGIPLRGLPDMAATGTGIAAKLHCSGYYLSGFTDERNRADISTYSPALLLVDVRHEQPNTVVATLGSVEARARYFPGLGCTLLHRGMVNLATLDVPAARLQSGPWPAGNEVAEPDETMQALLARTLVEDSQQGLDTRALLVVQAGRVIAEVYGNGISPDTPLLGWSMGKSLTALLVGRMEALGQLQRSDSILFPAWRADARREITVENLLQMSSGLAFSEPYLPGNDSTRMLFTAPSASDLALASPLLHTPGSYWYYSSGTSNLLARLVSDRLGGKPRALVEFFAREIAEPLGLRNTVFELDSSGVYVGSSYLYAPARDWARMALPMLNEGRANGIQWLPPGWVTAASTPNPSSNDRRYGYQFWLNGGGPTLRWPDLQADAYAMSGNRGQSVMIFPDLDAIVVRLGWTAGDYPVNEKFEPIQALLKRYRIGEP